jgi:hypothetical protein
MNITKPPNLDLLACGGVANALTAVLPAVLRAATSISCAADCAPEVEANFHSLKSPAPANRPPVRAPANAEVEDEVLRYLRNHPAAADTAAGIANGWSLGNAAEGTDKDLSSALDRLARDRKLSPCKMKDGQLLYWVRRVK